MFEHHDEALLPPGQFLRRLATHGGIALGLVATSLGIGMLGYHVFEGLSWLDALVNASMLLGGMGPVDPLHTVAGKLFASFYALYSGLIFLIVAGVLVVPVFHRIIHHFHLEEMEKDDDEKDDLEKLAKPENLNVSATGRLRQRSRLNWLDYHTGLLSHLRQRIIILPRDVKIERQQADWHKDEEQNQCNNRGIDGHGFLLSVGG